MKPHKLRYSESNNLQAIGRLLDCGKIDIEVNGIVSKAIADRLSKTIDRLTSEELAQFEEYVNEYVEIMLASDI